MKLLMHVCCGPCSVNPINLYLNQYELTLFWFNPNIHPRVEYNERLLALKEYSSIVNLPLIEDLTYLEDEWTKEYRCKKCYEMRIIKTCKFASTNNYEYVSTSLLASPYQDRDLIISLFEKYSLLYNLKFLVYDLRSSYHDGVRYFKSLGLYTQKHCGCIFSYNELIKRLEDKRLGVK